MRKNLSNTFTFIFTLTVLALIASGCASAEKSASMAIDNAASVVRTGQEKAWIDPDATPTPLPLERY